MQIPFLDLITPHKELEEELVSVFRESLSKASFVGGHSCNPLKKSLRDFVNQNIVWP